MARNKRAVMRREKREHEKLMNNKSNSTSILMEKYFYAGRNEGMELASAIIFLALHEDFGFGQKRIKKLMQTISRESMKMDELATKFNVDWYREQMKKVLDFEFE